MKWVQIVSWHGVRKPDEVKAGTVNLVTTLCGREVRGTIYEDLPPGRSCESCLRIAARKVEAL